MAQRPLSTASNKPPSSLQGAFASLGFDPPTAGPSTTFSHHTAAQQPLVTQSMTSRSAQPTVNTSATANPDPVPGDPGCVFINPPFTDFPGSAEQKPKTGLTYNILAANPNWFLDVNDFVGPNGVPYPSQLEPPRGWCPTKKKDAKDGWKEGEEPRLRCTLCRRQYSGVNAKSMWRRHVYEKHKVAMANRRENHNNERPSGRGARSSNKENKATSKGPEKEAVGVARTKAIRRVVSLEGESASRASTGLTAPLKGIPADNSGSDMHPGLSSGEDEPPFTEGPSFSSTPPQTPATSPSKAQMSLLEEPFNISVPPESPYHPDMTPAFRHSPAKLPERQPWKFNSPVKGQEVHDYTLTMLARCEASPTVRGLDVSPNELVPKYLRLKNWGALSPPREKSILSMSPRQLFLQDTNEWDDSIQSRLDQPGWEVPTTPGCPSAPDPYTELEIIYSEDSTMLRHIQESRKSTGFGPQTPADNSSSGTVRTPALHKFRSTPPEDYTPHTKMFINGIDIGSSPSPMPKSPSPGAGVPTATLLSPFAVGGKDDSRMATDESVDQEMEIDERGGETRPTGTNRNLFWKDIFSDHDRHSAAGTGVPRTPDAHFRRAQNSSTSSVDSGYFSVTGSSALKMDAFSSISRGTSQPRRTTSPMRSRGRSVSNAGASGSSSGHKTTSATVGLMDAILDKRARRRKHSHSEHRAAATTGDGEVGVTAFGSPFKMAKKTSRRDFSYSLDGDCEMQDARPKKRRKTISGLN